MYGPLGSEPEITINNQAFVIGNILLILIKIVHFHYVEGIP